MTATGEGENAGLPKLVRDVAHRVARALLPHPTWAYFGQIRKPPKLKVVERQNRQRADDWSDVPNQRLGSEHASYICSPG